MHVFMWIITLALALCIYRRHRQQKRLWKERYCLKMRMLAARHGITYGNRIVDRGCHRGMWYTAYAGSNGFCNGSFLFGDTVLGVQDRTSRAIRLRGLWYTIHGGETAGGIQIAEHRDTEIISMISLSFPLS